MASSWLPILLASLSKSRSRDFKVASTALSSVRRTERNWEAEESARAADGDAANNGPKRDAEAELLRESCVSGKPQSDGKPELGKEEF